LGPMVEGLRVVRSGIKPGDKVVLDGLARLQPGAVVTPKAGTIKPRAKNAAPVALPVSAPPPAEAKSQ
ncbi:MAG TPA: efflux transporter periplasmic adaptor subunit, partial [Erythrobacter sp.]